MKLSRIRSGFMTLRRPIPTVGYASTILSFKWVPKNYYLDSNYILKEISTLEHYRPNQVNLGSNSLRFLGPQIWS